MQDIGGSTGCCCVAICEAHPHVKGITCDLPAVHDTAQQYVDQHGMSDRVQVRNAGTCYAYTVPGTLQFYDSTLGLFISTTPEHIEYVHNLQICSGQMIYHGYLAL